MNFRQVHLDFHTSEKIPGIGKEFSNEQFKSALKLGHVNSITVFSKCHHGYSYHPTEVGKIHPNLKFDLLGEQIKAAHEIGVKTPVYLSAGWDVKMAWTHPEWLLRPKDDTVHFDEPGYHLMCMNTPYLDYLTAQIEEAVKNYDCDEIFLDIVGIRPCHCRRCVSDMLSLGFDPYNDEDVYKFAERTYLDYARRVREAVDKYKPGLPVFHNSGHVSRGRRDLAYLNSHLELESLPTGGWGYDHFPLSAGYARTLDTEYLGMTGKFHTTWGEFGGFKHPNALIYETALSIANGAKCSVGDQLHPCGKMDMATYALIGKAYAEVEKREPWLDGVKSIADIAMLSAEAVSNYYEKPFGREGGSDGDIDAGAVRILLEGKYLFDVVDTEAELDKYKLLILPDNIRLDAHLTKKINDFVKRGGKVLASGTSALKNESDSFAIDLGADYIGKSKFSPIYMKPQFDCEYEPSAFVMYADSHDITQRSNADVITMKENPYFNRTALTFSSHLHAPNDKSQEYPLGTMSKCGAYIGASLFTEYATNASFITKKVLHGVIDMLLGDAKTLKTTLPAQGVVTLMDQASESRLVLHALYASPVKRGHGIDVIEDIVPLYGVKFELKTEREPKKVYEAPSGEAIPFEYIEGILKFSAEKIDCHFMAVIDY